jgi:hypothetical protein
MSLGMLIGGTRNSQNLDNQNLEVRLHSPDSMSLGTLIDSTKDDSSFISFSPSFQSVASNTECDEPGHAYRTRVELRKTHLQTWQPRSSTDHLESLSKHL